MQKRLFVDMDGTLAVFRSVKCIETLYQQGYFLYLEPMNNVVSAIKNLIKQNTIDIFILSSFLSDSHYAYDEKSLWLDIHLPEIPPSRRLLIPYGRNKNEALTNGLQSGDYLLDDYTQNLLAWNPACGIKLLNGINHTHKTWQGSRISFNKPPHTLAKDITHIVKFGETIEDEI